MEQTKVLATGTVPIQKLRVSVTRGPDAGKSVTAEEAISVGTAQSNSLVLTDDTVSRYHLELTRDARGRIVLCDHDSTNGTLLAGARLSRAILQPGTTVTAGHSSLLIDDAETVGVEALDGGEVCGVIGRTPAMRRLMAKVAKVAASNASVLLAGETGSGKEVLARAIHSLSPRAKGPFETVDCGMMVPTLVGSELFGHEKGAFTGAAQQHLGAFERADGGTIFLDEIGELPPGLQASLLGVLERRAFRRLGGSATVNVDVRVVCATNRDLRSEVNSGHFRQDLYYRIGVIRLEIPPLRERPDDIPALAEHFLREAGHAGPVHSILPDAVLQSLTQHCWPGNVRELKNAVESLLIMGEPPEVASQEDSSVTEPGASMEGPLDRGLLALPYSEARTRLLERFEREYVAALLADCEGSVSETARRAKMSRTYLTKLLRRLGLRGATGAGRS